MKIKTKSAGRLLALAMLGTVIALAGEGYAQAQLPPPNTPTGLHTVLRSQEGGIHVAEADLEGIHAFALGHLPTDSLDLAVAGLLP